MSAWKYKQLMPRLTVDKLKLMDNQQITGLIGMSLSHISSGLEKTTYHPQLVEISSQELTSISLETALQKNFIKTCEDLMSLSSKGVRRLLSGLLLKFEANCVKTLLRVKESKCPIEEALKYVVPAGRLSESVCRKILESSEGIWDVIDCFSDFEYGKCLENAVEVYLETKMFYVLEVALDRYVYFNLWNTAGKLRGLDKKIAKTIIGLEVDIQNVKTIFRCKKMELSETQTQQYLIYGSSVLGEKELNEALAAVEITDTIESVLKSAKRVLARDHQYVFAKLQETNMTSLSTLENILDRGLLQANLRMIKRHTGFFNIGLLLAFLNLKWIEIRNLRAIICGSEAGISPERVKEMLILKK